MVDFKEDTWLYALIAAILAIIAIFTPWYSYESMGVTTQVWLGGTVGYITSGNLILHHFYHSWRSLLILSDLRRRVKRLFL